MKVLFLRRPSAATVIASIALLVALGGTSIAAVNALVPKNSVGTKQIRNRAVTAAKVKLGSLLAANFKAGELPTGGSGGAGATGQAGPAGATGPVGPAGPGAVWPLVKADGTILEKSGNVTMTSHVGPGVYVLDFHTAINDKLILASASFASPGYRHVVAGPCGGPPDGAAACSVGGDNNHVAVIG